MKTRNVFTRATSGAPVAWPLLFSMSLLFFVTPSATAIDSVWRADTGQYPDQMWPNWKAVIGGGVVTPVYLYFTNQSLLVDTSGGGDYNKVCYYRQEGGSLTFPTNLVIEARVRYVSGARTSWPISHCQIQWQTTNYVGNGLNLDAGEIFLWSLSGAKGTNAFVDTTNAPHTYRIEFNGTGANSPLRVYQDGVLVLTGTNYYNPSWYSATPLIFWGDSTIQGFGVTEWYSMRHNALTPAVTGLGKVLYCPLGKYLLALNQTNGQAAFVGINTNVPADPYDDVLGMAAHPQSGMLYSILAGNASLPKLHRLNPVTGEQAVVGTIQTTNNLLKSMKSLAYNPVNGLFYASARTNSTGTQAPVIVTVNPDTAVASLVTTISGTAQNDLDSLGFIGNQLYALDVDPVSSNLTFLYTVDLATGQATLVGSTRVQQLYGLAYNADDGLFFSVDPVNRRLLRLSPTNAVTTVVGATHGSGDYGGGATLSYALALVTPPGPMLTLKPATNAWDVAWPSIAGASYWVDRAPQVQPGMIWTNVAGPIIGDGAVSHFFENATSDPSRFYRLRVGW